MVVRRSLSKCNVRDPTLRGSVPDQTEDRGGGSPKSVVVPTVGVEEGRGLGGLSQCVEQVKLKNLARVCVKRERDDEDRRG